MCVNGSLGEAARCDIEVCLGGAKTWGDLAGYCEGAAVCGEVGGGDINVSGGTAGVISLHLGTCLSLCCLAC